VDFPRYINSDTRYNLASLLSPEAQLNQEEKKFVESANLRENDNRVWDLVQRHSTFDESQVVAIRKALTEVTHHPQSVSFLTVS
jgi:hypothetical protein